MSRTIKQRAGSLPKSIRDNFKRQHDPRNLFVMDIHDVGGHFADLVIRDADSEEEVMEVLRKTSEERTDG